MTWGPFDLLRPLFDFLICLAKFMGGLLVAGILGLVNLVIAGVMALVGFFVSLLPAVTLPSFGTPPWAAWLSWIFPIDQLLIAVGVVGVFLAVWHLAQVGFRWAKVVE